MKSMFILLSAVMLTMTGPGATDAGDLSAFYDAYLADKAETCAGKTCFSRSRCGALREYAQRNLRKAEFIKDHKERLIEKMIVADIGTKPYRLDYFLISEFGDFQRGQGLQASD